MTEEAIPFVIGAIIDLGNCLNLVESNSLKPYPNSFISSRLHIQVCVRNLSCIKGFFLPQPLSKFNPAFQAA